MDFKVGYFFTCLPSHMQGIIDDIRHGYLQLTQRNVQGTDHGPPDCAPDKDVAGYANHTVIMSVAASHRGRAGGPVRPVMPGVFLRRYLGRLLTYFDELNTVVQEIDHAFMYAKERLASYECENYNVFSYHESSSLPAV